jgi:hypothetical protein
MVYIQQFMTIPEKPTGALGFYAIAKAYQRGSPWYKVIAMSQIAHRCPLSPLIEGCADRKVIGYASLNHYKKFYINKYRTPRDFSFIHTM